MTDIFFYIEGFYNPQRRHSALGYPSPLAHEARYQDQLIANDHRLCPLN